MADSIKASLRVVLFAGETEVAESHDEQLWQDTLAKMSGRTVKREREQDANLDKGSRELEPASPPNGSNSQITAIERWASAMGVSAAQVEGACSPSSEAPYLHLDAHNWESLKKNTPSRGAAAVSPIKLAATLLALWHYYAKTPTPNVSGAQAVLKTIKLYDNKAQRGMDASEWLRRSGDNSFTINPGKLSSAIAIATAYVAEEPIKVTK